jgi:indolepyruvate decarboxylase
VDIGDDNYQAVALKEVLRGVIDAVPPVTDRPARQVEAEPAVYEKYDLVHRARQLHRWHRSSH